MFNSLRTAALMAGLIVLFVLVGRELGGPNGLVIAPPKNASNGC